jgi:threonine dehydratase
MIPDTWLDEAADRIKEHIHITPLTYDPEYDLYLKWENHQVTGSFKARGALNKVLSLQPWEQAAGLIAASAGNHGLGVALAGQLVNAPVAVYISENAVPSKIEAIRALGAEVCLVPGGFGEAEKTALAKVGQSNATWVSPYNDGHIIAGQGTLGLEILDQLKTFPDFRISKSVWVVPTSGGGITAGIGFALTRCSPRPRLVAVQSDTSAFMHRLYHEGTQEGVVEKPTIADGLAGPVEPGSITIPIIRQYVDDFILVTEEEIRQAVALAWQRYGERIEGSAAVTLAAVFYERLNQRPAVLVLTGGNIQPEIHQEIAGRAP